ncbi:MgtC/SapB family protein [Rhodobacteraceae bacterium F11138]|nr:MgtC/SapB family protein [Rhodobacteraceae bacterium F11138]
MWNAIENELSAGWSLPWGIAAFRLLGSVLLCGLIGFEREIQRRPAGLRTHMLIGLAATVYTLMMLFLIDAPEAFDDHISMDPVRVIESITSGVAFLAAGIVIFTQGQVKGLTTGASMWLAAAIGTAVGLGQWPLAVSTTGIALTIIYALRQFEAAVLDDPD